MLNGYLTEEEIYKMLTKKPPMQKEVALNFIKSYGTGRVIAAFDEVHKNESEIVTRSFTEKEIDVRFERINQKMGEMLRILSGVLS